MPLGAFRLNTLARYLVPAAPSIATLDAVSLNVNADDYTTAPNGFTTSSDFVASYKLTASAWIRVPNFSNRKCIFNIRTSQAPLLFVVNTDGSTRLLAGNSGYFLDARTAAGTISQTNTWYHIAISVDTSDTAKRWQYINGVQVASPIWTTYNTATTWLAASSSYSAGIAKNPDGGSTGGEADMDVSQIWIDNSYIDLSTNISKFYNDGPVDMGANGNSTGLSQPLIYHNGNTSSTPTFQTNGGRTSTNKVTYTFTPTGTPTSIDGPTNDSRYFRPAEVVSINSAFVSTALKKFGTASYQGAVSKRLEASMLPPPGDFTIEWWAYQGNRSAMSGQWEFASGNHYMQLRSGEVGGQIRNIGLLITDVNGNIILNWASPGGTLPDTTWTYIAVTYVASNNTFRVYMNSTLRLTQSVSTFTMPDTATFKIGDALISGTNRYMRGYLDELRVSRIARYTGASVTVPTVPFTNDANTLLLLHMDGANGSTVFTDDNS